MASLMDSPVVETGDRMSVILVSPNVSEQMGGEAIKALHIYLELEKHGVDVHQITHERVKPELDRNYPQMSVSYVRDSELQKFLNRIPPLSPILGMIFFRNAGRRIAEVLRQRPGSIVHFTSPVSPVIPYFRVPGATVVIGPLNGNIHHPPSFRRRETLGYRVRRWLHPILQILQRHTFSGKRSADALLVAGGERTYQSLRMAGCRDARFVDSIDSGVLDRFGELPRITHAGPNLKFFQNGRLISYKGTDLVIRSLTRTKNPITFDVIGRGPELNRLKDLTAALFLQDRVQFIDWIPHGDMAERLRRYRGFVFPSLAEANGIVVQEAMTMGLPVIALNWGGPSLLVTPETGFLIDPTGEELVIDELAKAMDRLAEDGDLAEAMSVAGRTRAIAQGFLWSEVIRDWTALYKRLLQARAATALHS